MGWFVLTTGDRIRGWETEEFRTLGTAQSELDARLLDLPAAEFMDIVIVYVKDFGLEAPKPIYLGRQWGQA